MYDWLIPIFIWFSSTGVTDYSPKDRQEYNMQVHATGSFEANSNALNADMLRFFMAGRFIDNGMKDRSLKRMKDMNRIGLDATVEFGFFHRPDSGFGKNWSYGIHVGQRYLFGGSFSKDAYQLGLYGNAPFAGQTLDLGGLHATYLSYQYLNLGFVKEFHGEKWHKSIGFGATYANANQFFSISAPRASIFTEQDGQYLDVDAQYAIHANDASKNKYFYPNGFGLAGSIEFSMTDRKRHAFHAKASNFGFMRFNSFSSNRSLDTNFVFEGVQIDNLFKVNGAFFTDVVDSLGNGLLGSRGTGARYMAMPGTVEIGYSYAAIPSKLFISALGDYCYFPGYVPRGTVRITGIPDPFVSISGALSYGGRGGFNAGIDLGFHFGYGWHFTLGTQSVQGIVAERLTSGLSGRFGLIKRFNKSKATTNPQ
ncbi:MAG: DUF5723 family protein [Flavobacteriales bacterium]|nr:DUF5723 family protein [Flavobacteriales bacterium]